MRGKADQRQGREPPGRITPAYAGKSSLALCVHHFHKDHPRICGEKQVSGLARSEPGGSPPHMRGKDIRGVVQNVLFGITPAYAGKRCSDRWLQTVPGDHPRICGEKATPFRPLPPPTGSPPHMRGKVSAQTMYLSSMGITPAYAGKRTSLPIGRFRTGDHPRICGEKLPREAAAGVPKGSPPHMRGKVIFLLVRLCKVRITPAYAGKRAPSAAASGLCWDHPRICGEKKPQIFADEGFRGSPPHMRGKVIKCGFGWCAERITPAYAGKSCP